MGQFSWIAQDTNRSISNINPKSVTMTDDKGNKWTENNYEGYGMFDGKDFYQLLAEMNNVKGLTGEVDRDRDLGIDLYFGNKAFLSPNLNEDSDINWHSGKPEDCPNQGWT